MLLPHYIDHRPRVDNRHDRAVVGSHEAAVLVDLAQKLHVRPNLMRHVGDLRAIGLAQDVDRFLEV